MLSDQSKSTSDNAPFAAGAETGYPMTGKTAVFFTVL